MLKGRKLYVVLGTLGALVILAGAAGVVYAQRPQPPTGEHWGLFPGGGAFGGRVLGRMRFGSGLMQGGPFQGLVEITAEVTGLSEDEVIAALESQTFAEIAEAEGVEPQEIVDAAVAEAESRLEEAVDDGRLTEEQMDQVLEQLAEGLPERLEQPWRPGGPMGGALGRFNEGFWTMYDAVAEVLGLTPEELFTELHDGKTVDEIAEEQGVEMEAIRGALEDARAEAGRQAIEQAVEDGRLTEEQADWMIEGLEQGFLPRGRGFRPGHGGRGRGMGW